VWNTRMWTCGFWNKYGNKLCVCRMQMCWLIIIWCIRWCDRNWTFDRMSTPREEQVGDFHPPSSVTLDSEVNLLRKIYCCAIWNVKLSRIVVWVLQRIYRCIILNVNCPEWLYEYYKRSTVVLYWMLIVTNGCMSITKDLSLYYVEGYLSRMFIWDLWRIYYCVIHSAKLLLIFVWVLQRICCCIILNINCH
jgi:hypothetical protein